MATEDDDEIALDTHPMSAAIRLWTHWRIASEEIAPGVTIWEVNDGGHVRIPVGTGTDACTLLEALRFVEFARVPAYGPAWLVPARRFVLRLMAWLNRCDPRSDL